MSGERTVILGEDAAAFSKAELKNIMREVMREVLPEVLPDVLRDEFPKILSDVNESTKQIEKAKLEAQNFLDNNPEKFNEGYKNRYKMYEGYARCMNLTKLYDECLETAPIYIPRKFRDDKYYVRDEEELDIINARFMGKFRSDYNLLKKRQRDFAAAVNTEDDIIYNFIEQCNVSDMVRTEIATIWQRDRKEDEEKINSEWTKSIKGMKIAYEKDRRHLAELNQQRAKKFEEIRQSARTVPAVEAVLDEDLEQEESDEEIDAGEVQETLTERPEIPVSAAPVVPLSSPAATDAETSPEPNGEEENATAEVVLVEETIDSSATLFDNTLDTTNASQSNNNTIQMMAGNFRDTPDNNNNNRTQHTYKFRRRPLLK